MSGKERRKRKVFSLERKIGSDGANCTSTGKLFQNSDAETADDRRPIVISR